jgi:hypothetical protein
MKSYFFLLLILFSFGCISLCGDCDDSNPCTKDVCDGLGCSYENLDGQQIGCNSIVPPCKIQSCAAGSCVLTNITNCCGNSVCESNEDISNCAADCRASIKLDCEVDQKIVPILYKLEDELETQFVSCTLINEGGAKRDVVFSAEILGWSNKYTESLSLFPGISKQVDVEFDWLDKYYLNKEESDASVIFSVESSSVEVASKTKKITISPKEDIFWSVYVENDEVSLLHSLVAWVTPHDPCINTLISKAKEIAPGRSLGGYANYGGLSSDEKANRTIEQTRAIYYSIKGQGISYVNTLISFTGTQHVNMPADSLIDKSGNCVDGTVLFASVFEALGMNTVLVFIPQHTLVGVETYPGSNRFVFIETTMVGSASFEEAYNEGSRQYNDYKDTQDISIIDVTKYRSSITPFPSFRNCSFDIDCSDGSKAGECSTNKPKLCAAGVLVDAASVCGCPTDEYAFSDSCFSSIVKNETFVLGKASYDRHYFWGPNQDAGTFVTYRYKVSSSAPIQIFIVPSEQDYTKLKTGNDFMHYPVYAGTNTLSYDQSVTHDGAGGIALYNDGGKKATVSLQVYFEPSN